MKILKPFCNWIWYYAFFIICDSSFAAPHPGVGSSLLSNPDLGAFLAPLGFRIQTLGTDWVPRESSKTSAFESYRLGPQDEKNIDAFLSVRTDNLDKKMSLDNYVKKWIRDYPQLGFEFYGTKALNLQGSPGLVIDFIQRAKEKQVRQVILQKGAKLAVLTCTDKRELFNKTLATCNKIIRSFEWVETANPTRLTK